MTFTKQSEFTDKVTNLPDYPTSSNYTAVQIKTAIQQPSEDLKVTVNKIVDDLNSVDWVDRPKIAPGAVGTNELDPAIFSQPTTVEGVQAKFQAVDEQLADIAYNALNLGANGDFDSSTQIGTDDTTMLQSIIDNAYTDAKTIGTLYSQTTPAQPENLRNITKILLPDGVFYVNGTLNVKGWTHLESSGNTIIVLGPTGKINFSLIMTKLKGIAVVSKSNNPVGIEFQQNSTINPESVDMGICIVEECFFKNLQEVFTFKADDHTFPTNFIFQHNKVTNCKKLTSNISSDKGEIRHNSFTGLFDTDVAYITNKDTLHVADNIFTPQDNSTATSPERTGMRWFDNYGKLIIEAGNRFGNEPINRGADSLTGKQITLVRNYADIVSTVATTGSDPNIREMDNNKYILIIEDNQIYHRNVPCVEFYGLPSYFKFIGNTGLVGTRWNADFDITNTDTKLFDFTNAPSVSGSFQTWRKFIRFEIKLTSESAVFSDATNNQLKLPTPYNVFMVNEVGDNFANKYMPASSASGGLTQFDIKTDYLPQSFTGIITFYGEPQGDGAVAIAKYELTSRYYKDLNTGSMTRQLLLNPITTQSSQSGTGAISAPAMNYSGYGGGGATTTDPTNTTMRFKLTNLCLDGSPLKAYCHLRLDA